MLNSLPVVCILYPFQQLLTIMDLECLSAGKEPIVEYVVCYICQSSRTILIDIVKLHKQ